MICCVCVPSPFIFMDEVFLFPVDWPTNYMDRLIYENVSVRPTKGREDQSSTFHPVAVNLIIFMFVSRFDSQWCGRHFLLVFFILSSSVRFFVHFFFFSFAKIHFFFFHSVFQTYTNRIHIESTKEYTRFEFWFFFFIFSSYWVHYWIS